MSEWSTSCWRTLSGSAAEHTAEITAMAASRWNGPQRGEVYPGLLPQPPEYEPFLAGIPGIHFELPDDS